VSVIRAMLESVPLPRIAKITQGFDCPYMDEPIAALRARIAVSEGIRRLKPGDTVAVTAGSRGIHKLPEITREIVRSIREAGGAPFVFPAMGSHGGATAEGQRDMLESMGLTEEFLEAPIKSSMEIVEIGRGRNGLPVYQDKYAREADWIVPVNRIKPHTTFRGKYESGIVKMLVIGMGKQKGADICHSLGPERIGQNLEDMIGVVMAENRVLFAVASVENAGHGIAALDVLEAREIMEREPELLAEANGLIPSIPFDPLDVLVIDEIGKDISGTGADVNIIGRYTTPTMSGGPRIARVAALNLSSKTGGNANGIGVMDFVTRKIFERMSFEETYPNSLTTTVPGSVKIPMVLENDRLAIQAALKTCNTARTQNIRFLRIRSTMSLSEMIVSENLLREAENNPRINLCGFVEWNFDKTGNLKRGPGD